MKKQIPDLPWPWIAAFASVVTIGSIVLWQLKNHLEERKNELASVLQEQQQMLRRRFTPSAENIEALGKKNKQLSEVQQSLQGYLSAGVEELKAIREINAINFKQHLSDKVKTLTEEAKKKGVRLPSNFYFGYSLYNSEVNPPDRATVLLQKQLLAIEAIVTALYDAGIEEIHAIRRSPDPAEPQPSASSRSGTVHPDFLTVAHSLSESGHYSNIPIEIEFSSRTDSLRKVLNSIYQSSYVFIPRYLEIKSSRTTVPRLSDFQQNLSEESNRSVPIIALGDETFRTSLRIDLIEWTSSPNHEHISIKSGLPAQ